jgi:hypothetical protein
LPAGGAPRREEELVNRAPIIALSLLAAAAMPAATASAAGSRVAYFKVSAQATQDVIWTEDVVVDGGHCGSFSEKGHGRSWLRLHTPAPEPAIARQIGTESRVQFSVKPYLRVEAALQREGTLARSPLAAGSGADCGQSGDPIARDCGLRRFPVDTRISLAYDPPDNWPGIDGTAPLVPSLHISGPYSPQWLGKPLYQSCPGDRDDVLGVDYFRGFGRDTGAAGVSIKTLFGTRRRFTVDGFINKTQQDPLPPGVTGTHPVTKRIKWSVTFTRITRRARSQTGRVPRL